MKYLPLVWAALTRKPVRAILTLLSMTVAFTLFGLMLGLNSTIELVEKRAHADRVFSFPRFSFIGGMPIAVARQIARMPHVRGTTVSSFVPGYVTDPKNRAFMNMGDDQLWKLFPDWGITKQQWDTVQHNRTGMVMSRQQAELWHKKIGDTFTIISPQITKADGTKTWTFKILAISEDIPQAPGGINFANYDYFDKSLPPANQGKINEVDILTDDPSHAAELAQQIDQIFANSSTPTQSQTEQSAFAVSNNFGGMDVEGVTDDIALTGLLMILFLSANVIAQSVRERFAEFATLKTFGFSDRLLITLIFLEAVIPCVTGSGLGVALAAWLAHQIPSLMPPGFALPMPTMSATVLLWAAIGAFVMAFVSATLPALRLSRMDIATALSGRT